MPSWWLGVIHYRSSRWHLWGAGGTSHPCNIQISLPHQAAVYGSRLQEKCFSFQVALLSVARTLTRKAKCSRWKRKSCVKSREQWIVLWKCHTLISVPLISDDTFCDAELTFSNCISLFTLKHFCNIADMLVHLPQKVCWTSEQMEVRVHTELRFRG